MLIYSSYLLQGNTRTALSQLPEERRRRPYKTNASHLSPSPLSFPLHTRISSSGEYNYGRLILKELGQERTGRASGEPEAAILIQYKLEHNFRNAAFKIRQSSLQKHCFSTSLTKGNRASSYKPL